MLFDIKITYVGKTIGFKSKSNTNYKSNEIKNLIIETILNENNSEINNDFDVLSCKFKVSKDKKKGIFYYRTIFKLS
jgi:hypothetical protein